MNTATRSSPEVRSPANIDRLLRMYRRMLRIRAFDQRANELYLSAKMPGLTHMYIGQEAVAVGVCEALEHNDAGLGK